MYRKSIRQFVHDEELAERAPFLDPDEIAMASHRTESPDNFASATSPHGLAGDDKGIITDEDDLSPQPTVSNGQLADVLEPHESYEGKHRWDPAATWDPKEERALVRKTDLYLLTWICVMFFGLQLGTSTTRFLLRKSFF